MLVRNIIVVADIKAHLKFTSDGLGNIVLSQYHWSELGKPTLLTVTTLSASQSAHSIMKARIIVLFIYKIADRDENKKFSADNLSKRDSSSSAKSSKQ